MPKKEYRTAIYCRLSKEDGDKPVSTSIEGQIAYCKDFVNNQKDLKLAYEPFCDDGYSGGTLERPAFREMDRLVREGKIDCIVCRDLSRFTRDYIGGGEYLESILPRLKVRFIAINNCDTLTDDSQTVAFVIPLLNLINDTYSRDISVKIRSSLIVRRKSGDYVGAFCAYGYKRSDVNRHKLVPDDNVTATVQLIFSMYKDGLSVSQIAQQLNTLGVLTPLAYKQSQGIKAQNIFQTNEVTRWEYNMVKRILSNDIYIGTLIQGKCTTKNYKVKKSEVRLKSEWIVVENAHESIIQLHDFLSVQELLERNTRMSPKEKCLNVLSGFVFCGDCGGTMIRKSLKSGGKQYVYYVCANNKRHKTCSSHSINANKLEDTILDTIHYQMDMVLNLEEVADSLSNTPMDEKKRFDFIAKLDELELEIKKYKGIKLNLYTDLNDGIISQEEYHQFKEDYNLILEEKEKSKAKLEKTFQQAKSKGNLSQNWVQLFTDNATIEEINRRVLMDMVGKILIYEHHNIEIIFKFQNEMDELMEYIAFRSEELAEKILA